MAAITGDEWREKSQRGELCGIIGCEIKPTTKCPKCLNHYCYSHLEAHGHVVTDKEIQDQRKRNERLR